MVIRRQLEDICKFESNHHCSHCFKNVVTSCPCRSDDLRDHQLLHNFEYFGRKTNKSYFEIPESDVHTETISGHTSVKGSHFAVIESVIKGIGRRCEAFPESLYKISNGEEAYDYGISSDDCPTISTFHLYVSCGSNQKVGSIL